MKKNQLLAGAVLLSLAGWNGVAGADVYELAPVTVTASRYEKKDVSVASSTQVISEEALQMTGQDNLQQALGFLDSVSYVGMSGSDFLKLRTRCGTTILRFYISLLITI